MRRTVGEDWLSSLGVVKDAEDGFMRQNMMPRRLRAHPTRQRRKRVESLREEEGKGEGGDYASIGLH